MIDKYVSSARNLSALLATVAITAIGLATVELNDLSAFRQTRTLIARWILLDQLQGLYVPWRAFNEESLRFELSSSWSRDHYYEKFGYVTCRKRNGGFEVEIKQPTREEGPSAALFPQIPDLRPWKKTIPAEGVMVRIFRPISEEENKRRRSFKEEFRKLAGEVDPEELKKEIHPSWLDPNRADPIWLDLNMEKYRLENQLAAIYLKDGIDYDPDDDPSPLRIYRELEKKVFSAETKVPLIDLTLSRLTGFLTLLALQLLLIALARESMVGIRAYRELPRDEPWLVLDASDAIGRVIGMGWTLSILLSPIFVAVSFGLFLYSRHVVGDLTGWSSVTNQVILVLFTCVAGALGLHAYAILQRLRKMH